MLIKKNLYAGLKLYHTIDLLKHKRLMLMFIDCLNKVSANKLTYYNFMRSETASFTRYKKVDPHIIVKELDKNQYSAISLFDKFIGVNDNKSELWKIKITIFFDLVDTGLYRIEILFDPASQLNPLLSSIRTTLLKDFRYGYIYLNHDFEKVMEQTSLIPASLWKSGENILKITSEEDELFSYQQNEDKVASSIFKAHWGNFLNSNHINKLGGFDKVFKESPTYRIERLSNGAYLQLTESCKDYFTKTYKKKLKRLDEYFGPIKIKR